MALTLSDYRIRLTRLVVNRRDGRASPHKVCMLLAALDLAGAGGLGSNRILYEPPLLERYARYFEAVRHGGDHANPYFPFFHLSGTLSGGLPSFWHLHALPGRESALPALGTARSHADITENIAFVTLDQDLFELLQLPENVDALSDTLANHWFDRGLQDLRTVSQFSRAVSRYERQLREGPVRLVAGEPPPAYVRSPAFRRVVIEAYDYRCAASGMRVLLNSGDALVEAAHILPFHQTGDDDPRNGLALTPNMHWAMDRNLIAPGPDFRWHVSPLLDKRVPDFKPLVDLDGQTLLMPKDLARAPRADALAWRVERLRDPQWSVPEPR